MKDKKIKLSSEHFEKMADTSYNFIVLIDKNAKPLWANKAWLNEFGALDDNTDPFKRVHPQDLKHVSDMWKKLLSGELDNVSDLTYKYKSGKGKYLCINTRVQKIIVDGNVCFYVTANDITKQNKAEKELKDKILELEKTVGAMVGRELKMIELKKKLKK